MHELAITQSMVDLVLEEASKVGAKKVERINLVIGDMSGIVGDSVQFYFEFLSKGTVAQGAELRFKNTPTQARCRDCGELFKLKEFDWCCPGCGKSNMEIVAGNELYVDSIEVE